MVSFPKYGFGEEIEGIASVVGDVDDATCAAELFAEDLLVDEVVFYEEDVVVVWWMGWWAGCYGVGYWAFDFGTRTVPSESVSLTICRRVGRCSC